MEMGLEEEEKEEEHKRNTKEEQTAPDRLVLTELFVILHYLIYSKRNRTAKAKAPLHPPLPPAEAVRKEKIKKCSMEKLQGGFD